MGPSTPSAPNPTPPSPTPPPPLLPSSQPTAQQTQNVGNRLYAADGQQSTILSASNVNTQQDVVKKSILGG